MGSKRRHYVAVHLNDMIAEYRWSNKSLAKAANVTCLYVKFLRNFATEERQIWYLLSIIDRYTTTRIVKPSFFLAIPELIKTKLESSNNISKKCEEIYLEWKKNEN